ncbi:MAG: DoxX family membrane protein [Actinomycetales bacterium]|nr:DoxX family membrane protein [Actinomycetales bacterium]
MAWDDAGRLILRGAVAAVFGYAAVKHARSRDGSVRWLTSVGYRDPERAWMAMTATEGAAAASLALGLGTAAGAAAVNGAMTSAVMTVHRANGWPEEKNGVEWPVTLMLATTALAVLGPGRWSVDAATGLDRRLDGGVGLLIAVGGVAVGLGQVATSWSAPVVAEDTEKSEA